MSSPSGPEESTDADTDEADVERDDAVDHLDAVDASEMPDAEASDDESQWRFGIDEVGEDGAVRDPLEPESVSAENALFVVVGVLLTLGVVVVAVL